MCAELGMVGICEADLSALRYISECVSRCAKFKVKSISYNTFQTLNSINFDFLTCRNSYTECVMLKTEKFQIKDSQLLRC